MNCQPILRLWSLWKRFLSTISMHLAAFIFLSIYLFISIWIATSHPVPAAEKHTHGMMLPPRVWKSFRCFFGRLGTGFHVFCKKLQAGHSAVKPWLMECCIDSCLFRQKKSCLFRQLSMTLSHPSAASLELSQSDFFFLLFKDHGHHCTLRNLNDNRSFWSLEQICAWPQFCLSTIQSVPST